MSAIQVVMILTLVAVTIALAAGAARTGVALSSDPQDLAYWFGADDEELDSRLDPHI